LFQRIQHRKGLLSQNNIPSHRSGKGCYYKRFSFGVIGCNIYSRPIKLLFGLIPHNSVNQQNFKSISKPTNIIKEENTLILPYANEFLMQIVRKYIIAIKNIKNYTNFA